MIQRRNYILVTVFFLSFQLYKIRKLNDSPLQNAFFLGEKKHGNGNYFFELCLLILFRRFRRKKSPFNDKNIEWKYLFYKIL